MTGWLKHLQNEVTEFLFPRICIGCGKFGDFICVNCSRKLIRLMPPLCRRCGKPETSAQFCPECWRKQDGIDAIRSVFIFEGLIKNAIYELKYRNLRSISELLGKYMADYYRQHELTGDYLMPVPLHIKRIKQRGYNQSELLARRLAELTGVPLLDNIVQRVIDNMPQARTASVNERKANVENIFQCDNDLVSGKEIIIIDDVCTTGATLDACAKALKLAGARRTFGFTLAREVLNRS